MVLLEPIQGKGQALHGVFLGPEGWKTTQRTFSSQVLPSPSLVCRKVPSIRIADEDPKFWTNGFGERKILGKNVLW